MEHPEPYYGGCPPALEPSPVALPGIAIARPLLAALAQAAERAWPRECCGIVAGRRTGRRWCLLAARPLQNRAADSLRGFVGDPAEFAGREAELRRLGLAFCGFYHSHPGGGDAPSAADLQAAWPGAVLVIVPIRAGRAGEPAFWWPGGRGGTGALRLPRE